MKHKRKNDGWKFSNLIKIYKLTYPRSSTNPKQNKFLFFFFKNPPRHIIIKSLKTCDKEKIIKEARGKRHITYRSIDNNGRGKSKLEGRSIEMMQFKQEKE